VTEGMHTYRLGKIRTLAVLFGTWLLVGVAIPSTTTFLRLAGANAVPSTPAELIASQKANNTHYEATVRPKAERPMSESSSSPSRIMLKQLIPVMQVVLIDRWTGLEGVMAAVAYPHKDMALLKDAAVFHRSYGTVDVYTRKISGSSFTEENAKKYHYATLAGPIAFLYFSGSLLVVFFGMALISLLMSAVELFWVWLVRDRLIVAMSGLYLALIVLQFSGGLVQAATGVVTVTFAFAGIWLLGDMQDRTPGTHGPEQSKRYGIGY
jgi:hypothetical protein